MFLVLKKVQLFLTCSARAPPKDAAPSPAPGNGMECPVGGRCWGGISKDAEETKARQSTGSHAMPEQWPFCSIPRRPNPETMRRDGLIQADTQRQMRFRARGEWLTCFPPSAWQVGRASVSGCLRGAVSLAPTFLASPGATCEGPERVHLGSRAWDERGNSSPSSWSCQPTSPLAPSLSSLAWLSAP